VELTESGGKGPGGKEKWFHHYVLNAGRDRALKESPQGGKGNQPRRWGARFSTSSVQEGKKRGERLGSSEK